MANDTIGTVKCPLCGRDAEVRQQKGGKLYFYCAPEWGVWQGCGKMTPNLPEGQKWLQEHARIHGSEPAEPKKKKQKTSPAKPEKQPEPEPKRNGGILGDLW